MPIIKVYASTHRGTLAICFKALWPLFKMPNASLINRETNAPAQPSWNAAHFFCILVWSPPTFLHSLILNKPRTQISGCWLAQIHLTVHLLCQECSSFLNTIHTILVRSLHHPSHFCVPYPWLEVATLTARRHGEAKRYRNMLSNGKKGPFVPQPERRGEQSTPHCCCPQHVGVVLFLLHTPD